MNKYSTKKNFYDPVVRCEGCRRLLFREDLSKTGQCGCGKRKFTEVRSMSEKERKALKGKVDPDFLDVFEPVAQNWWDNLRLWWQARWDAICDWFVRNW